MGNISAASNQVSPIIILYYIRTMKTELMTEISTFKCIYLHYNLIGSKMPIETSVGYSKDIKL